MKRPRPLARVAPDPAAPLVLAIDSSGPVEAVALARGDLVLASTARRRPRGRGTALAARIQQVLGDAGCAAEQLSAVACVTGPGSFTGLRVAIATAQGLARGLDLPTVPIDATFAWALGHPGERPIAVTLDARRSEVYGALWSVPVGGEPEALIPLALRSPESWFAALAEHPRALLVGDGARLYSGLASQLLPDHAALRAQSPGPSLGAVAAHVARSIEPAPLIPVYLRDHDAAKRPAQVPDPSGGTPRAGA